MSINQPKSSNSQLMTVKNLTDKSADLYIYGEIVDNTDWKWDESDVMPQDVLDALNQVKGLEQINIYINSPGGSVFSGQAIYNMLKRNKAKKIVHIDGVAASIASVIALAGDEIKIPSNAFMMIHQPWTIAVGSAKDFRKIADDLEVISSGMMKIYEDNMKEGVEIETIKQMVDDETWLSGEEVAKYFDVEVVDAKSVAACSSEYLERYEKTPKNLIEKANEPIVVNDESDKTKFQNELDLLLL